MRNEMLATDNATISLKDIVNFHLRNRWPILIGAIAGGALSTVLVLVMPDKYEANWQIEMAKFVSNTGKGAGFSYINSEEPAALIQRLRMPTSYTEDVHKNCGVRPDGDAREYLDGLLKVGIVKNVPNSVEMKVRGPTPAQAKQCAEALVAMIAAQQRSLINDHLDGRQAQLTQYRQALQAEQQQLNKIKQTALGNFGYLAKMDNLSWLRSRIDALEEEARMSSMHPVKLVAPIHASGTRVSPKVGLMLLVGTLLGVMLGFLYALAREGWRKAT